MPLQSCAGQGFPMSFIDQARVLLKTEELFALWRAIGEVSSNPAIGLLVGTENRTERFHPIGLAALSAETFGAAIDQMARYKQLTCPEEILQEKDDEEWSIQFRWLLADQVEPPVLNDCCFAWILSIARRRDGYAPLAAARGICASTGARENHGASLRVSRHRWRVSQCNRVSRRRCRATFCHAEC